MVKRVLLKEKQSKETIGLVNGRGYEPYHVDASYFEFARGTHRIFKAIGHAWPSAFGATTNSRSAAF